jgi:hypothetical protein
MATLNLNTEKIDKLYIGGQLVVESGGLTSGSFIPIDRLIEKRERQHVFEKTAVSFDMRTDGSASRLAGEYDGNYVFIGEYYVSFVDKKTLNFERHPFPATPRVGFIFKGILISISSGNLVMFDLDSKKKIESTTQVKFISKLNENAFYIIGSNLREFTSDSNAKIVLVKDISNKSKNITINDNSFPGEALAEPVLIKNNTLYYIVRNAGTTLKSYSFNEKKTTVLKENLNYYSGITILNESIYFSATETYKIEKNGTLIEIPKFKENAIEIAFCSSYNDLIIGVSGTKRKIMVFDADYNILKSIPSGFTYAGVVDSIDNKLFVEKYSYIDGVKKELYNFDFSEKIIGYTVK